MAEPSQPERPSLEHLAAYAEHFNESITLRFLGVRIEFPSLERVRVILDPVQPGHRGGLGTSAVNGGVLAGIFDLAIGITAALIDPMRKSATMQLSIQFERPTRGNRITAEGFIQHSSKSTLFSAAEIYDEEGTVSARATGLVKWGHGTWTTGASPGQ